MRHKEVMPLILCIVMIAALIICIIGMTCSYFGLISNLQMYVIIITSVMFMVVFITAYVKTVDYLVGKDGDAEFKMDKCLEAKRFGSRCVGFGKENNDDEPCWVCAACPEYAGNKPE